MIFNWTHNMIAVELYITTDMRQMEVEKKDIESKLNSNASNKCFKIMALNY